MKTAHDLACELGFSLEELEEVAARGEGMYFFKTSRSGEKVRVLRCPKERLSRIQQAIQKKILHRVPLPPTMHGWRRGRSPRTYADKHVGRPVVLNFDIRNFFPNV